MTNRNASPSAFGWDFQVNAGIVILLDSIREAKAVKIEGKTEDIEVVLQNGTHIFAQAKSSMDPEDSHNAKSDLKKAMSRYHKEIKKIAAAHLNKNYEPSSMKDYQEALDKARSACKKGSPDIEIIMEELRKAVQNLRVLT